jgi:large subunit ribosomal protein L40e
MPVTDIVKRRIAQRHKLYVKICRSCGVRNPSNAVKCRKCRGKNLRWKNRDIGGR